MARRFKVMESVAALSDYERIEAWLADVSGDMSIAERIIDDVREAVSALAEFPHRGTRRDDILPGLRIMPARAKSIIAFTIDDDAGLVRVLRVFYGGEDYDTVMRDDPSR